MDLTYMEITMFLKSLNKLSHKFNLIMIISAFFVFLFPAWKDENVSDIIV